MAKKAAKSSGSAGRESANKVKGNDQYSAALEASGAGVFDYKVDLSEPPIVSEQCLKILGYDKKQISDFAIFLKWFYVHIHASDRQNIKSAYEHFLKSKHTDFNEIIRFRKRHQEYLYIRITAKAAERTFRGSAVRVCGAVFDIDEYISVENDLKKKTEILKESQAMAHIGHWEFDIMNNNLYWSDEIYKIFELDPQKIKPSYEMFLENIHPDDREFVNNTYLDSVNKKTQYDIIHRIKLPDGRIKYVNERCQHEYSKYNEAVRSIGTIQDITNLKKAELANIQYTKELKYLNEINRIALSNKPYEILINKILSIFRNFFNAESLIFFQYDKEEKILKSYTNTIEQSSVKKISKISNININNLRISKNNDSRYFKAITEKKSFVENNPENIALLIQEFSWETKNIKIIEIIRDKILKIKLTGAVPLLTQNGAIGLIVFNTSEDISREILERLDYIGSQIALILENFNYESNLQLMQHTIDNNQGAILWIDQNGTFFYSNAAACKMLGCNVSDVSSLSVSVLDRNLSTENWSSFFQTVKANKFLKFESEFLKSDNSLVPVEISMNYINYNNREYLFVFASDISRRAKAEKELKRLYEALEEKVKERTRELHEKNRLLIEQAAFPQMNPAPVLRADSEGIIILSNPASKVLGKKIAGKSIFQIFSELKHFGLAKLIQKSPVRWEREAENKIYYFVIRYNDETRSFYIYGSDVTDRKEIEKKLQGEIINHKQTEAELNKIFNLTTEGLVLIDKDFVIRKINKTFIKQLELKDQNVIGLKCHDVLKNGLCLKQKTPEGCPLVKALKKENLNESEVEFTSPSNKLKTFIASVAVLKDSDGVVAGIIKSYRDITDRKKGELEKERLIYEMKISRDDLKIQKEELEKFNKSMVGRELRIIELKEEINSLCRELNREPEYLPVWENEYEKHL